MLSRRLSAAAIAVAAAAVLAGCSAGSTTDHASETTKSTPKSTPAANPTSEITPPPLEQASVECTDGTATIADLNNKEVTVADCATVIVTTSNALIHLGAVDDLTVKGAINGIEVKSLKKVVITGDGNRVSTPDKPKVTDKGKSNTVNH